jgi:hypothetical protein
MMYIERILHIVVDINLECGGVALHMTGQDQVVSASTL